MNSLASAYQKAGMRTKAREMLETNYQKTREVRGEEHPDTVNALNNLNAYYFGEKLFEKMITSYQQALQKAQRNNSELDKLRVMVSLTPATLNYDGLKMPCLWRSRRMVGCERGWAPTMKTH